MVTQAIKHVLLYVDGNRRWAKKHTLSEEKGYAAAGQKLISVLDFYREKKVSFITLYACSTENIRYRSEENKEHFLYAIVQTFMSSLAELKSRRIRIIFIGNKTLLPPVILNNFSLIEEFTGSSYLMTCYFLCPYGGREELLFSVRKLLTSSCSLVSLEKLSDELLYEQLCAHSWLGSLPEPDFIIRPAGGVTRLSNGPLLHSAYSELFFLDCFWPELHEPLLEKIWQEFLLRKKTRGR